METIKKEMLEYFKEAINLLEKAMNLVESDENFNDGQSAELNRLYDFASEAVGILKIIK